jgi:hypothetical protein
VKRRSSLGVAAVALLLSTAVVWGSAGGAVATESTDGADLPPAGRAALVKVFGPLVAPLGLRVTRAALVDTKNRRSAAGTHLAVYVEPVGTYTPEQYIDGLVTVSRVFVPRVFRRWDGLRSFDVCQEPRPARDASAEPPPETQVFVRRRGVGALDWQHADVGALLTAAAQAVSGPDPVPIALTVYVAKHLRDVPAYASAAAESRAAPDDPYR